MKIVSRIRKRGTNITQYMLLSENDCCCWVGAGAVELSAGTTGGVVVVYCPDLRYESSARKKAAKKIITKNKQAYFVNVCTNLPVQIFSCFT